MELFICCFSAWNLFDNSCNLTAKLLNEEFSTTQLTFRSDLPIGDNKTPICDIKIEGYNAQTEGCEWARTFMDSRGGQCLETRSSKKTEPQTKIYSIHGGICLSPIVLTSTFQPNAKTINLLAKSILNLLGLQPITGDPSDGRKLHAITWGIGTDLCQIESIPVGLRAILQTPEFCDLYSCLNCKQISALPIKAYQTASIIGMTLLVILAIILVHIYKWHQ